MQNRFRSIDFSERANELGFARMVRAFEAELQLGLAKAWAQGWQPAEVVRALRHQVDDRFSESLALHVVGADHASREAPTMHPRWVAHIEELGLPRIAGQFGWLSPWATAHAIGDHRLYRIATTAMVLLGALRPIPIVIAPPGSVDAGRVDLTTPVDDPVLQRVRSMLAKAESTTFDAEAESFTAKAQELMTRHAITEAMLDARRTEHDVPATLRIAIDEPYVTQKAYLLDVVAIHTRCRCVTHTNQAMSSIVGMPSDIAAVEVLFTSLLVQGTASLNQHAKHAHGRDAAETRDFRKSFWAGYAQRIGQRLQEINEYLTAEADTEHGGNLLPALAARSIQVDHKLSELFPHLTDKRMQMGSHPAGWQSGKASADKASINAGAMPKPTQAIAAAR